LRPQADNTDEISLDVAAAEFGKSKRTAMNWLAAWHAMGVPGIRKIPAPGGFAWRISRAAIAAWQACDLPDPRDPHDDGASPDDAPAPNHKTRSPGNGDL